MITNKWLLLSASLLAMVLVQLSGVDWTTFGVDANTAKQVVMAISLIKSVLAVLMPPTNQTAVVPISPDSPVLKKLVFTHT